MNDDALLVERAQAGDRQAFGQLVERYQDRVFNALTGLLGCREEARDAAQDAFVQAWRKLDAFRGDSQFYTWLYRVAMNLGLSRRRRRRATVSVDQQKEDLGAEPIDPAGDAGQAIESAEQIAMVRGAVDELADEHRQIIVLRELEGMAYDDIAETLELPVGTVRSRLFRARAQLKDILHAKLSE